MFPGADFQTVTLKKKYAFKDVALYFDSEEDLKKYSHKMLYSFFSQKKL